MKLLNLPERARLMAQVFGIDEDFRHMVSADEFTSVLTDTGTATVGDEVGGVLTLSPSDGTVADNDEAYIRTTKEIFKFAENKPITWEHRLQFAEANTDDANIATGLFDGVAADTIVDNGAGVKTSGSGFGFYKVDGGTLWNIYASLGATQTLVELTAVNSLDGNAKTAGGSAFVRLGGVFVPKTATKGDLYFTIDDVLVYKITDFVFTSATEMHAFAGVKNGGTTQDTLKVDYFNDWQKR